MRKFEQYTDVQIVSKVLEGETPLYEIIIRRYNPYLFKIARSYGFKHTDAEDLMQDTYVGAYTNLKKFESRSSFKTWLIKIMLNNCYHKKQKLSSQKEIPTENFTEEGGIPLFSQNHADQHQIIMNKELGHVLENALKQIPEDYRIVFSLRELNGMNTNETSEVLNISEANVKVRLNRAKNMLKKEIEKMYSPNEIFEFNLVYCDRMVDNVMNIIEKITRE